MAAHIHQLFALASKGVTEATMLLKMKRAAVQHQDDQDRRWRNMSYAVDQLKAQGKEPATCQDWVDVLARYGFDPANRLSAAQRARPMRFDQFMAAAGGFSSSRSCYAAQGEPDAPSKCEGCRKQGAALRCSWCGEWYCSPTCFVKDWKDHRPTCTTAVDNMHCDMPPTPKPELWPADLYAKVYGLATPAAAATAAAGSSDSSGAAAAAAGPAGTSSTSTRSSSSDAGASSTSGQAAVEGSCQQQQQQQAKAAAGGGLEAALAALGLTDQDAAPQHGKHHDKNQKRNAKKREKQKQEKAAAVAAAAAAAASGGGEQSLADASSTPDIGQQQHQQQQEQEEAAVTTS